MKMSRTFYHVYKDVSILCEFRGSVIIFKEIKIKNKKNYDFGVAINDK